MTDDIESAIRKGTATEYQAQHLIGKVRQVRTDNERLRALLERIMPFAPEGLWQEAHRALEEK